MRLTWQTLRDRAELLDCLTRYAQGVDQRCWPLYDGAFHPDAQVHVPGYMEGTLGFVAFREMLAGTFDTLRLSGQHLLGNMQAEIDGDRARTVTEFLATTLEDAPGGGASREVTPGLYIDEFRHRDGEWRIVRHTIVRKAADGATLPFEMPVADAVRSTLATRWLLHSGH
ncbi:nuclear transport factor 2 family protein [Novosphingobium sp. fls2-241-R2A-195]|uniref:nuclear transport factor 2 family protein n=1 Tax=Novosphingobium sp. fls2-241-R2A-195 TaxID=3040296 RepID=UPI00254C2562|nr:nuclear transport factor 2 family protein [Novosphingobium sp. fls2-241-R2A-195]